MSEQELHIADDDAIPPSEEEVTQEAVPINPDEVDAPAVEEAKDD